VHLYNERVVTYLLPTFVSRFKLAITVLGIALLSAGVVWLTDTRGASDVMELSDSTPQGPGLERYVDPVRGFLFDYPDTLSLSETENGEDHVIFGDTAEGETRLLIVAYPYVLDEPLTEDIIQAQSFAGDISTPIDRMTLPSGTTAFLSRRAAATLGATRDALFTHNGTAYQVSVVADFADLFNQILQSWRFTPPTL
jgi:hypothetical protein